LDFHGLPAISTGERFHRGLFAAFDTAVGFFATVKVATGVLCSGAEAVRLLASGIHRFGIPRAAGAIAVGLKRRKALVFSRDALGLIAV
jgi:hypothetical protein